MPSANKTQNIELNQWQGNEFPKRQDFNDDNQKIDTKIKEIQDAQMTHEADTMPHATKKDITYYVRPDGNDANDGSANDATHAFKTIQHAIDILPSFINHEVTIQVASGIYNEDLEVSGLVGKKWITIQGHTNLPDESNVYTINSIFVATCPIGVIVKGFKGVSTTSAPFKTTGSQYTEFRYCLCDTAAETPGFLIQRGITHIILSNASNRSVGINALMSATVYSNTNSGTGNTVGLKAETAATIGKNGTQPGGTTAEEIKTGGVIR